MLTYLKPRRVKKNGIIESVDQDYFDLPNTVGEISIGAQKLLFLAILDFFKLLPI